MLGHFILASTFTDGWFREEFETLADGIFQRIQPTIAKCITESGVTIDAIDSVEIVGGSSRVPKFKDIIAQVRGASSIITLCVRRMLGKSRSKPA